MNHASFLPRNPAKKNKNIHPHHLSPKNPNLSLLIGRLITEVALDQLLGDVLEQKTKNEEEHAFRKFDEIHSIKPTVRP